MSLVELRDAEVTYSRAGKPFVALHGTDLTLRRGERLGVVGGSGSGKTTMARLMVGLLRPSRGDVRFDGRSIVGVKEKDRGFLRSAASMVFQDPNSSLNPRMRLADIVAEPLRSPVLRGRGDMPQPTREVVAGALHDVGLSPDVMDRYPHQLSGGQRQRVAIARALISDPSLLVADEPVSALDVSVRAQVLNVLTAQVRERSLTLVLVSHDLATVRHMCARVAVVNAGRIVEEGAVDDVLGTPRHPYTAALVDATLTL